MLIKIENIGYKKYPHCKFNAVFKNVFVFFAFGRIDGTGTKNFENEKMRDRGR